MVLSEPSSPRMERIETCVCVPARGERAQLPRLLEALLVQRGLLAGSWCACFLLDGCPDDSAAILEDFARLAPFAVCVEAVEGGGEPNAGRARRAAMAMGLRRLDSLDRGVLLTTDADSAPAPDWIAAARRALRGADVVAGRVTRVDPAADGLQSRLELYYDRLYALRRTLDPLPWEPEPRHHFTGGANLGLRAAAYVGLGGFAELACGEDAALVDDAVRAGLRVRRDARVVVVTSSRRDGRAPGGLAAALRAIDLGGEASVSVAHPADAAWQYRRHAVARASFDGIACPAAAAPLSALINLPHTHLIGVAAECANGEAFANRIVPARPGASRLVPLAEAEAALTALELAERCEAA